MEIADLRTKQHKTKHNLTCNEKLAFRELTSNMDLVINRADKGSTIMVRHRNDCIREETSLM